MKFGMRWKEDVIFNIIIIIIIIIVVIYFHVYAQSVSLNQNWMLFNKHWRYRKQGENGRKMKHFLLGFKLNWILIIFCMVQMWNLFCFYSNIFNQMWYHRNDYFHHQRLLAESILSKLYPTNLSQFGLICTNSHPICTFKLIFLIYIIFYISGQQQQKPFSLLSLSKKFPFDTHH